MTTTKLQVSGMSCGTCVKHVTEALRPLPGVRDVKVELSEGRAQVEHDERTSAQQLVSAVKAAGYGATAHSG